MGAKYGWTGKLLHIDLGERKTVEMDTSPYIDRFIGGKGIGEKIYWDTFSSDRDAFHPDSPLILMTGPLAATTAPSASRWILCGKSPSLYPEHFVSANLGAFLGASLKRAGYDGLVIQGKADRLVYIAIENESVVIKDASHLRGCTTDKTMDLIKKELGAKTSVLTTGPAGENVVRLATAATDLEGSGSMGFGAVMGSKNLKAVAVNGKGVVPVAHPEKIKEIRQKIKKMMGDGYFNLYGSPPPLPETEVVKQVHCSGCPHGCWRSLYRTDSGEEGIRKCQSTFFYSMWDRTRHGDQTKATFLATSLANKYSLCSMELPGLIIWLEQCLANGVITEKETELPMDKIGSVEFIEAMVKKISSREGFGNILAEGVMRAADTIGKGAKELALDHFTQTGRGLAYGPKIFSPSAMIYATEARTPTPELHEICAPLTKWALWYTTQGGFSYVSTDVIRKIAKRFWGSERAADFSTYDDKAQAAVNIQNRQHAKECLIVCDFTYPIYDDAGTDDHLGDPTIESRLLSAVTGKDIDETELNRCGERVFTLNRAILHREGRKGRQDDYIPESQFIEREEPVYDVFGMFNPDLYLPASGDDVVSRKGKAMDREGFERLLDEYYRIRGWNPSTGLCTKEKLKDIDLQEVIEPLDIS